MWNRTFYIISRLDLDCTDNNFNEHDREAEGDLGGENSLCVSQVCG